MATRSSEWHSHLNLMVLYLLATARGLILNYMLLAVALVLDFLLTGSARDRNEERDRSEAELRLIQMLAPIRSIEE